MTAKKVTGLVVLAATLGLCVFDLLVYLFAGNDATISRVLLGTDSLSGGVFGYAVAFLFGGLTVHLFKLQQTEVKS